MEPHEICIKKCLHGHLLPFFDPLVGCLAHIGNLVIFHIVPLWYRLFTNPISTTSGPFTSGSLKVNFCSMGQSVSFPPSALFFVSLHGWIGATSLDGVDIVSIMYFIPKCGIVGCSFHVVGLHKETRHIPNPPSAGAPCVCLVCVPCVACVPPPPPPNHCHPTAPHATPPMHP